MTITRSPQTEEFSTSTFAEITTSTHTVFAFRGRRGDKVKLLYWDGQGFCLYYKVLQRGRFPWPSAADGTVRLTSAQLAMLWEGIDWRRPGGGVPPARVA